MKRALIILIVIIFSNCFNKGDEVKNSKYEILFLKGEIKIPNNYKLISLDDYEKIILEKYTDTLFLKSKRLAINAIKENFSEYAFFYDEKDFENTLIIYPSPNQNVNKYVKDDLINFMTELMKFQNSNNNFSYESVENKMIGSKIIKVKGRLVNSEFSENNIYSTQYIFEGNGKVFMAYVMHKNRTIDFEKEITEIKYD
ncbi:hypothetical protein [Tenacibaculum sp. M341]|uniref:hypothetical protein n=1 Tax=Tenacibaculum sp. M341 TaxID=2530339 RepID=UPI00104F7C51|nr:hypothetical protein [Tenacibaculum sp. M341]TCI90953.1 hypothetical protein EYW44_11410 [Tenacibaculum sp. M341]